MPADPLPPVRRQPRPTRRAVRVPLSIATPRFHTSLRTNNVDDDPLQRHNPAPGVHLHSGESNLVFLTVTVEQWIPWLATETTRLLLHQTWSKTWAWLVGDYLLMLDHLHLFCAPHDVRFTIETWIAYWKREFRLKHERPEWKFQSRGWHHRLRAGESYAAKWLYVQENPVRKGLVWRIEDWPFKGRVFDLRCVGD